MASNSSYVNMGDQGVKPGTSMASLTNAAAFDDPNLSQEDRDLRLALALQQQENAAAYDAHKKRHDASTAAKKNRTSRSNCSTSLASIRQVQKKTDSTPAGYAEGAGSYAAPGTESSDAALAAELQKVEQTTVGAAKLLEKIVQEDSADRKSNNVRNGRSLNTM